jgi:hypothetical protein
MNETQMLTDQTKGRLLCVDTGLAGFKKIIPGADEKRNKKRVRNWLKS